jgi:hypothetical protein
VTAPIATRVYQLHTAGGASEVTLRIYRPEPLESPPGDHRCRVEILGLPARVDHYAYGGDALQALLLAVTMASADLRYAELGDGGYLTWFGGRDLGIPFLLPDRPPA